MLIAQLVCAILLEIVIIRDTFAINLGRWENPPPSRLRPRSPHKISRRSATKRDENSEQAVPQLRILGGRPAVYGEIPFQGRIHQRGVFQCGASLINHCDLRFALTAAHCVYEEADNDTTKEQLVPLEELDVIFGDVKLDTFQPREIWYTPIEVVHHEYYDPRYILNDIAMIRVEEYIYQSLGVEAIDLPGSNWVDPDFCQVSGWGSYEFWGGPSPDDLQVVEVPVVEWEACKKLQHLGWIFTAPNQFCLGNNLPELKGICVGDSGGPAVAYNWTNQRWYQAGVCSYSINKVCGDMQSASTFSRLTNFRDWILGHAQGWLERYGTGNEYTHGQSYCLPNHTFPGLPNSTNL